MRCSGDVRGDLRYAVRLFARQPGIVLLAILGFLLPFLAVHRGGRQAIAKEHQALHDALTGLPNRALFLDRLQHALDVLRHHEL